MGADDAVDPQEEIGELERWGRAFVTTPVVTAVASAYLTDRAANAIGADGVTLDPVAADVTENFQTRIDWIEGSARHAVARLSGASQVADEFVDQIGQEWRSEAGRFYNGATSPSQVDAVEAGMRDGFTGAMRHFAIEGSENRRNYLRAWKWSRGWKGRMSALRGDVRTQVGLKLGDISATLASRRRQDVWPSGPHAESSRVGVGRSAVEVLRDDLNSLASYAEAYSVGLASTLEELDERIRLVDALMGEADLEDRNLVQFLVHAREEVLAAADAVLVAAGNSREQAARL